MLSRVVLFLLLLVPSANRAQADEGTNMTVVSFYYKKERAAKRVFPATFISYGGKYYFCLNATVERLGTNLEAMIAKNCEVGPTFESVDKFVDWNTQVCKNPYVMIYATTSDFEEGTKNGAIPSELVFELSESQEKDNELTPVSVFRTGPGLNNRLKLSIVDQVSILGNDLKPDNHFGYSGFYYLDIEEARIPDSLGSPVFRQIGAKRKFEGVYTLALNKTLDKKNASYVRVADLVRLIDNFERDREN